MTSFSQFLVEANSVGSKFEQKIARNVNAWIKDNKLQSKFKASRFQKISETEMMSEDDGARDEDYSDVVVDDLTTGEQFFIECKKNIKDNIITTQFDISEDYKLVPVKYVNRDPSDDPLDLRLAKDLESTDGFNKFVQFMESTTDVLKWPERPADYYFNRVQASDKTINSLIKLYNEMVDEGKTEADCKKFDGSLIRESTRNMLVVALLWKLDTANTWDICCAEGLDYFGDLVRKHYLDDKEIPAKYLQLGDDLFISNSEDNPFDIECQSFPSMLSGKFYLKFTPRFGTGSMYITPRSSITDDLESNCSFDTKDRWPLLKA